MQRILKASKNFKNITSKVNLSKKIPIAQFSTMGEIEIKDQKGYTACDAGEAISHVAYACTETAFIYPITPSSYIGERVDEFMSQGKKNLFGNVVSVNMLQSEGGAAGSVHGSLAGGSLTTSFTCSQGLLLKIPNMYLIAGELLPMVLQVTARTISRQSLSIHGDHSDVMACRSIGWAQIFSSTVQEAQDLAFASYCATLEARVPIMHIIDGFKTSHQVNKIKVLTEDDMRKIYPTELIQKNLRDYALNPHKPIMRGTGQRPDIFFQAIVANQPFYDKMPAIVEKWFKKVSDLTGRPYKLFQYYGDPKAEYLIISMGSSALTVQEIVDHEIKKGRKVGSINVKLFRPWSMKHFIDTIPKTVKKISVLDRCREDGCVGQPLYQDVVTSVMEELQERNIKVVGGQYGLSSKDLTPGMVKAVVDNMYKDKPRNNFTVGIIDDVNQKSLPVEKEINTCDPKTIQTVFWGVGSDGTIGANKQVIKNIALKTNLYAQGFFSYDAFKTDGTTQSCLRFGPVPIRQQYDILTGCDFVSCSFWKYCQKYDMLGASREGGTFLLNTTWTKPEEFEQYCKPKMLRDIAEKKINVYIIDAKKIAQSVGLGKRTNNIMATAFYKLSGVLPYEMSEKILKEDVKELYSKYGDHIVKMNNDAIDKSIQNLIKLEYPREKWLKLQDKPAVKPPKDQPEFIEKVHKKVLDWEGDKIPVSAFEPGGYFRTTGTTAYEKRLIGYNIPVWIPENCTQCNYCSLVCPHAVIRPYLLTKKEQDEAPKDMKILKKAKGGSEMAPYGFTIQISGADCTACEICVKACPDKALVMEDVETALPKIDGHFDYCKALPEKKNPMDKFTIKGSQFEKPLMEFSGACSGCGETPYVKLVTQLWGKNTVIANATGCSMIWGSMYPSNPYTTTQDGRGPAYGHSLFEDNAEYGYGIVKSYQSRVENFQTEIQKTLIPAFEKSHPELVQILQQWIKDKKDLEKSEVIYEKTDSYLSKLGDTVNKDKNLKYLSEHKDLLTKKVFWIIGGDGWAYDIGFGGLDHIMTCKDDFNVLLLDTEMYSNTGGQQSKSTPLGAGVKFALDGKKTFKKDIGKVFMQYEDTYVAQVAMGADMGQCIAAFKEAESFNGPSIISALSPCIDWKGPSMADNYLDQKLAVECGYWPIYRRDPRKETPFQLDSKTLKKDVKDYLKKQLRFDKYKNSEDILAVMKKFVEKNNAAFRRQAMNDFELLQFLKKKFGDDLAGQGDRVCVLYGSETGNAKGQAETLVEELKKRNVQHIPCVALDDFDINELSQYSKVFVIISTCGQGEFPQNSRFFWENISKSEIEKDLLKNVEFAVFGLGDSSYVFFNETAKKIDQRFAELGGKRIQPVGLGDDKADEKFETEWNDWAPNLYNECKLDQPKDELLPPNYEFSIQKGAKQDAGIVIPEGWYQMPLSKNQLMTPENYDRDVRHYEFDMKNMSLAYDVGDCLAIRPENFVEDVDTFLEKIKINGNEVIQINKKTDGVSKFMKNDVSWRRMFSEVLDIFGRPNRRFYEFLGVTAKNENEKKEIKHLLSKEGKKEMQALIAETATCADILLKYPSAMTSLDYMIDYIPQIKPRLYSIASSNEKAGDKVELCIIVNDWNTPSGKYRQGLCTKYLKQLKPGAKPVVQLQPGAIHMPEHNVPVVLIGVGTGIAPIRAYLQDRSIHKSKGEKVAGAAFFFGNRYEKSEYLYEQELKQYAKDGVIELLCPAWSRDQAHKIYVQDRIRENPDLIYKYLYEQKGALYICGSAGKIPAAVRKTVQKIFVEKGKISEKQADEFITNMQLNGKWDLDVW